MPVMHANSILLLVLLSYGVQASYVPLYGHIVDQVRDHDYVKELCEVKSQILNSTSGYFLKKTLKQSLSSSECQGHQDEQEDGKFNSKIVDLTLGLLHGVQKKIQEQFNESNTNAHFCSTPKSRTMGLSSSSLAMFFVYLVFGVLFLIALIWPFIRREINHCLHRKREVTALEKALSDTIPNLPWDDKE